MRSKSHTILSSCSTLATKGKSWPRQPYNAMSVSARGRGCAESDNQTSGLECS